MELYNVWSLMTVFFHLAYILKYSFLYFWLCWLLAVLGVSLFAVCVLLVAVASFVAEHRLQGAWVSVVVGFSLNSCGA